MPAPKLAAVAIGAAMIALLTHSANLAAAQAAGCPKLPEVAWWDTTPEKIVTYVDQTFQGDWDPYIAKWETYRIRMAQIHDSNGAALVRSRGLRLEGDTLAEHIRAIDERLNVTRCLKNRYGGKYV